VVEGGGGLGCSCIPAGRLKKKKKKGKKIPSVRKESKKGGIIYRCRTKKSGGGHKKGSQEGRYSIL